MHNVLDTCISITNASGRGSGNGEVFGSIPFHRICTHPKHYAQGCINNRCIGGFMHKKLTREV
jgi:hypothetical protein